MKALQVSVKRCSNVFIKALFLDLIEETWRHQAITWANVDLSSKGIIIYSKITNS